LQRQDFVRVQQSGHAQRGRLLVVLSAPGDARAGFTVSRKVGNAVCRNKVRRRLRDIVRLGPGLGPRDYVIIARPAAATAAYRELEQEWTSYLQRD
jgi:ribonuclease P protein component